MAEMKTISHFSTSSPSSSSSSTSSQQQVRNSINDSTITILYNNNHIDNSPAHDPSNLHVSDIEIASTISRGTTPIVLHSSSSLCPHLSTDDNTPSTPTNASVHSPKINNYNNNSNDLTESEMKLITDNFNSEVRRMVKYSCNLNCILIET